jgi:hypothetical protein
VTSEEPSDLSAERPSDRSAEEPGGLSAEKPSDLGAAGTEGVTEPAGEGPAPARVSRRRPPPPPRRGRALRIVATAAFLAVIGFLIWYFAFGSDGGGESEPAGGGVTLAPRTIDFGDADVGKRGAVQRLTLSNSGAQPAGIASIRIRGRHRRSFAVTRATSCNPEAPLNEADTCSISVRFQPKGRGERDAALVVRFVGGLEPVRARLRGTGLGQPEIVLATTRVDFGDAELGAGPETESTTVRNSGNIPLRFDSIELEGADADDFRIVQGENGCSPKRGLKPRTACTLTVRFTPSAVGERTASLVVRHDAPGSPSTLELAGVGLGRPQGQVKPAELAFGPVRVNRRSAPKTVTLENTGSARLTVQSIALDGENPRDFRIAGGSCEDGARLQPGDTCTVELRFRPRARGKRAATLVFEANTRAGRHTVSLRGTGTRGG